MNYQLIRVDDRLIHGQVVLGWASHLGTEEIILCDDSVSENDWEKELYLSVVPEKMRARVLNVNETINFLGEEQDLGKTIILVSSPFTIESILKQNIKLPEINVGGIHFKDGRNKYLPYLYLNDEEVISFKRCIELGAHFQCQDMPESKGNPLDQVLKFH